MALTDYTTYDEVRAVLGVAEEELEDEVLALPLYATELEESIYALAPGLPAAYVAIKAEPLPTPDQARFLRLMSVWASYTVGVHLLGALSMFAPKTIESDKDKQERVQDPYLWLRGQLPAAAGTYASRILALYLILFPGAPVPIATAQINVVNAGLATDPITG